MSVEHCGPSLVHDGPVGGPCEMPPHAIWVDETSFLTFKLQFTPREIEKEEK